MPVGAVPAKLAEAVRRRLPAPLEGVGVAEEWQEFTTGAAFYLTRPLTGEEARALDVRAVAARRN